MARSTSSNPSLQRLLALAERSDTYEEDAQDYLEDNHVPYCSHNRISLITLAWSHGWRPF